MGQKVHPYGFRLGTLYGWQSNWFAERRYGEQLHEDLRIRKYIKKKLYHAGIARVVIDRTGDKVVLNIHTARPGILIGKRGAEVEVLREELDDARNAEIQAKLVEAIKIIEESRDRPASAAAGKEHCSQPSKVFTLGAHMLGS